MESPFANRLATFNEVVIILFLYTMMYFSDFLTNPVWRDSFGKVYIVVLCLYIIVHLVLLCFDSFRILYSRSRYVYNWVKRYRKKKPES